MGFAVLTPPRSPSTTHRRRLLILLFPITITAPPLSITAMFALSISNVSATGVRASTTIAYAMSSISLILTAAVTAVVCLAVTVSGMPMLLLLLSAVGPWRATVVFLLSVIVIIIIIVVLVCISSLLLMLL